MPRIRGKVGGQWRFARAEINHWIETQLHGFDDKQLTALESEHTEDSEADPLITSLLSPATMAVPLPACMLCRIARWPLCKLFLLP